MERSLLRSSKMAHLTLLPGSHGRAPHSAQTSRTPLSFPLPRRCLENLKRICPSCLVGQVTPALRTQTEVWPGGGPCTPPPTASPTASGCCGCIHPIPSRKLQALCRRGHIPCALQCLNHARNFSKSKWCHCYCWLLANGWGLWPHIVDAVF